MRKLVNRGVSRREFLRVSALAGAGVVSVACGAAGQPAPAAPEAAPAAPTAAPAAQEAAAPAAAASQYSEAPMLAELVKAGQLPAVDERLPVNPMVMPVVEMIGSYGGTLRRGFSGVSDRNGPIKCQDRAIAWYDQNLNIQPRMAESWELSADAKEWTLHLREGMKWSDGAPFTAADIQWWWEKEATNATISPAISTAYLSGAAKTPMTLEVVDDYTVKCIFADPKPLFIHDLRRLNRNFYEPGHYLAQFHADLTTDAAKLEADTKAAGFNAWNEYYLDRALWHLNPELPTVGAWNSKNKLSEELFLMERNPYFFAVDAEGQQLPYVDSITHRLFESPDVFNLRIINGEVDFQNRHVALSNFTLYKENEAGGDYQVLVGTSANHQAIQLNLTTKNERLREFFNQRDVRIALSIAVDRTAINELVFDGLYTPRQYSPLSLSPQAYPKQAEAHIEYDVDAANALLDGAGYAEKNADGLRLWPGTTDPISFIVEGTAADGTPEVDALLQVVKYYKAVGISASYKFAERALYEEHYNANEIEAAWWGGDRTVLPLVAPIIWTCEQPDRPWAVAWSLWKRDSGNNPNGEEPPADHWVWKIWDIWGQVAVEPDAAKQTALFHQILDIWAEELPMIGYLGEAPALIIVKNGVRNYIGGMPVDDPTGDEHLLNTETYFWETA
ncbi:MAG: ABC transporter substrate-binding protein [Chloroflexi bacterium]|nr:MAG: ABC transporter substrate-binding protein [Chloroflexota bacterium]